jgi:hypothetical protein
LLRIALLRFCIKKGLYCPKQWGGITPLEEGFSRCVPRRKVLIP